MSMSYAIVKTGGKQYRVEQGQSLLVERLPVADGEQVHLQPLLYVDGSEVVDGEAISGVSVAARVVAHERGPKLRVVKFKPKRGYKRRTGHRQELTRIEVTEIKLGGRRGPRKASSEGSASTEGSSEGSSERSGTSGAARAGAARTGAARTGAARTGAARTGAASEASKPSARKKTAKPAAADTPGGAEAAGAPAGETSDAPAGETSGAPAGETSGAPAGETSTAETENGA
jgi:large subunit ribosomal protein L21